MAKQRICSTPPLECPTTYIFSISISIYPAMSSAHLWKILFFHELPPHHEELLSIELMSRYS